MPIRTLVPGLPARLTLAAALLALQVPAPALADDGPSITIPGALDLGAGAEVGNANAQYNMGVAYLSGLGVKPDAAEARRWFEKAARQGEESAQWALGQLWELGLGGPRDPRPALAWYRQAAERGHAEAAGAAGRLLAHGDGVPADAVAAKGLLAAAAERGEAPARFELAVLLAHGPREVRDPRRAQTLLREAALELDVARRAAAPKGLEGPFGSALAALYGIGRPLDRAGALLALRGQAAAGHGEAMYYLGEAEARGWAGPPRAKEAAAWREKAVARGYVAAMTEAGEDSNHARALGWLRAAARTGWARAEYALGARLFRDDETRAEGRRWLALAAGKGHPMAAYLATTSGRLGVQPHHEPTPQERAWLELAATHGIAEAAADLANYWLYNAKPRRPDLAATWLERAGRAGDRDAARRLGELYAYGQHVPVDGARAFTWYLAAHRQGDGQALAGLCLAVKRMKPGADLPWAEFRRALEAAVARGERQFLVDRAELVRRGLGEVADPARARTLLLAAAEQLEDFPQATAWATLGDMAAAGEGGPRDDAQALAWYRRATAAYRGHQHGAVQVALMTRAGRGVKADPAAGLALLEAAIVSNGEAMGELGRIYLNGDGVPQDLEKARHNLLLAHANGWPDAARLLRDITGPLDRLRRIDGATYWPDLERRAAAGDVAAAAALGEGLIERAFSAAEVQTGLARLERAAKAGHVPAMRTLASALEGGVLLAVSPHELIAEDHQAALRWLLEAARHGDHEAQLAASYDLVRTKPPRAAEAFRWAGEAVKGGTPTAYARLGEMYAEGVGTRVDGARAIAAHEAALRLGDKGAHRAIARIHAEGLGVPKDARRGFQGYLRGAEAGDESCYDELARRYELGDGVTADVQAAIGWYEKAFRSTNHEPAYALARLYTRGPAAIRNETLGLRWYLEGVKWESSAEDEVQKYQEDELASGFRARWATLGEARYALAEALRAGKGLPRDPAAALTWFEAATYDDDLPAALALAAHLTVAEAFDAGQDVATNADQAKEHYGHAARALAEVYVNPFDFLRGLRANRAFDLAFGPVLASLWKAAEAGYAPAQYELGWLLRHGRAVPRDDAMARGWLERARAQGFPLALPDRVDDGSPDPRDEADAPTLAEYRAMVKAYRAGAGAHDAANGGHGERPPGAYLEALQALDAALKAGHLGRYQQSRRSRPGVIELVVVPEAAPTPEELRKWAAERGVSLAEATFFWNAARLTARASMARNATERCERMREAAEFGSPEAMVKLIGYLARGQGTPADPVQAYRWACLARAVGAIEGSLDELAEGLTPDQIAGAQREAAAWWTRHLAAARS